MVPGTFVCRGGRLLAAAISGMMPEIAAENW
jgi:hypothetical protein